MSPGAVLHAAGPPHTGKAKEAWNRHEQLGGAVAVLGMVPGHGMYGGYGGFMHGIMHGIMHEITHGILYSVCTPIKTCNTPTV